MVLVHLQPVVIVIVCHDIATDGGVGGVLDHGLCLDRSVALTLEGLIRPHSWGVGQGTWGSVGQSQSMLLLERLQCLACNFLGLLNGLAALAL